MSVVKEIYPVCDNCHTSYPDTLYKTVLECRRAMKKDGWKIINGADVCHYCVDKKCF